MSQQIDTYETTKQLCLTVLRSVVCSHISLCSLFMSSLSFFVFLQTILLCSDPYSNYVMQYAIVIKQSSSCWSFVDSKPSLREFNHDPILSQYRQQQQPPHVLIHHHHQNATTRHVLKPSMPALVTNIASQLAGQLGTLSLQVVQGIVGNEGVREGKYRFVVNTQQSVMCCSPAQKYSSNVVEKLLQVVPPPILSAMVRMSRERSWWSVRLFVL